MPKTSLTLQTRPKLLFSSVLSITPITLFLHALTVGLNFGATSILNLGSLILIVLVALAVIVSSSLYLYHSNKCRKPVDHDFRVIVCQHCGYELTVPIYCGNRFCNVCSAPRLSRVRKRLNWICASLTPPRGYGFKHLTLTLRNESDLPIMLSHLVRAFRKLRQRAFWKQHVLGGAFVLEVTGRPGNWHAHLHMIIESRYIPYHKLLQLWLKVSGSRGVWIANIPKGKIVGYLTKYLSKSSVPLEITDEVARNLNGLRLFQPFGTWYAISQTYRAEPTGCPVCKHSCWFPSEILYRQLDSSSIKKRGP